MWLLRLRWTLRDARRRWIQIVAISITLAIGIGMYAGLASVTQWRILSIDKSVEATAMYDLRATVSEGADVPAGSLARIASGIDGIERYSERLVFDTLVETVADGAELLAHGRIVGMDLSGSEPVVNDVYLVDEAARPDPDSAVPQVLVNRSFSSYWNLPERGTLTVGGDISVETVGVATSPEYFLIVEGNGSLGRSNLAVMFAPLAAAQNISGRPGVVNDLVLRLRPGADATAVSEQLLEAAASQEGVLLDVLTREETASYVGMTGSPELEQGLYDAMSLLIFAGAAFAALNFSARMVESQRREIGASMAIGERPRSITTRPLMIGLLIGVLSMLLSVVFGYGIAYQTVGVVQEIAWLPIFERPFQTAIYAQALAIGFAVPMLAVLWPVVRAVRVRPVDAIRSGHLSSRGGSLGPIISRIPLPGRSLERMPFRNLMRAPRRTFLTLATFTMSLAIMIGMLGLSSTYAATFDQGNSELVGDEPDRFMVQMDSLYPLDSPQVRDVLGDSKVRFGEPGLVLGANATSVASADGGDDDQVRLELAVRFVDFGSTVWTPTASQGSLTRGAAGIALAEKASRDLGVGVGDEVAVTHPVLVNGELAYSTSVLAVTAIHPHPLRVNAYLDMSQASAWGFGGLANVVTGVPAAGSSLNDVRRSLFGSGTGVALVQGLGESLQSVEDSVEQSNSVVVITQIFVTFLVMLIAFNSANINVDERSRDHATMFAYGIPVRRVIANLSLEGVLLGVVALALATLFGYALLLWMVLVLLPTAIPDLALIVSVNWWQMALAMFLALAAIAVAPMLPGRKLKKMFIPGHLRLME